MKLFPTLVTEESTTYAGRVRVLSPEVAHRIAAGEVIERPASAVKELIENSLDAGASRVEVEIEDGGVALIRVSDDGSGMSPEDAGRAVAEHATSKIRTADDLASVVSLGFRGEALHAIGAVSDLALTTRERGAEAALGARVRVFAGEMVESATAAHPQGTTVEARDLFLNLPVRRGFLGTVRAEANAVTTVVESLALSRPEVGFFLRSDGRRSLAFPAAADLRERISQVHGLSLARSLVALEDPVVSGFVSPLAVSFPTRRYLHVAVNGRVVEADSFAPAVAKAYADLLPKGRHPAAFLRLELGPGEVDVNVHPAKSAVRLRGGRSAYPLVVGTIRSALAQEREVGGGAPPEEVFAWLSDVGNLPEYLPPWWPPRPRVPPPRASPARGSGRRSSTRGRGVHSTPRATSPWTRGSTGWSGARSPDATTQGGLRSRTAARVTVRWWCTSLLGSVRWSRRYKGGCPRGATLLPRASRRRWSLSAGR